jgi:hypothetical protein
VHTVLDDHSRLAYAEIHNDETAATAVAVLRAAVTWFADRGVTTRRVLSDNGSAYRSHQWDRHPQAHALRSSDRQQRVAARSPRVPGQRPRLPGSPGMDAFAGHGLGDRCREHRLVPSDTDPGANPSRGASGRGQPPNRSARRIDGKSDRLDAEQIARAVLNMTATATPKSKSGTVEVIRTLPVTRASAVKSRTQAFNTLFGVMIGAPSPLRDELVVLAKRTLVNRCLRLRPEVDDLLEALAETERVGAEGRHVAQPAFGFPNLG